MIINPTDKEFKYLLTVTTQSYASGVLEDRARDERLVTLLDKYHKSGRRQAVDISPLRCVNQKIYLLTTGARESAFRNVKTIAECLADELINAAKGSSNR
ncbi:hypothetical protein AgCh_004648 [Apium graveolens]